MGWHLESSARPFRKNQDRNVRRAYPDRSTGRRPVRRHMYRWSDAKKADLRDVSSNYWRETTVPKNFGGNDIFYIPESAEQVSKII